MDTSITYHVQIVFAPENKSPLKRLAVLPPLLYLHQGDSVVFSTKRTKAVFYIPNGTILFKMEPDSEEIIDDGLIINVEAGQSSPSYIVKEKEGEFPYAVYCSAGNDFAEGYSSPKMIVED